VLDTGNVSSAAVGAKPISLSSPDGNLTIIFELKENPQPYLRTSARTIELHTRAWRS